MIDLVRDFPKQKAAAVACKPYCFLIIITLTIFIIEFLIMILFDHLPYLPNYIEAFCDALLLPVLVFPALYLFLYRPLKQNIAIRKRAEVEKDLLIDELQTALNEVKALEGIIPICASCKKIRDDQGYWHMVEAYISAHTKALFSHGICPECTESLYPDFAKIHKDEQAGNDGTDNSPLIES